MDPLITKEQSETYVKNDGGFCPFCGSDMIEGDSYDYETGCVWQKITCLKCDKVWHDVYALVACDNELTRGSE